MRTISLTKEQAQLARDLGVPLRECKGIELSANIWAKKNTWFGRDHKKTADVFEWHTIITDYLKIDPKSKEYYKIINICSRYYDKQKKVKK
jgi:hypothetical protein